LFFSAKNENEDNKILIQDAALLLNQRQEIVAIPTEKVYGLAGTPLNENSIKKISS
jgi:tRNA A37 threonylcarbamoyladenosine synthetase subunit TsaC/SUA5/YrdC